MADKQPSSRPTDVPARKGHKHSATPQDRLRRREVWQNVACPECGAQAGHRCRGVPDKDGHQAVRYASHGDRWTAQRAVHAGQAIPAPAPRREVWQSVDCPGCGAQAGHHCLGGLRGDGSRRERKSSHQERWTADRVLHASQAVKDIDKEAERPVADKPVTGRAPR